MKIILVAVGKVADADVAALVSKYVDRLGHYVPFELRVIPDVRLGRNAGAEAQKVAEGQRLLEQLQPGDHLCLLDERGRQFTSRQFAEQLQRRLAGLQRNLVFAIGGPYGFSQPVYDRADTMMALSQMTLPHELARLFMAEQLYRACTILRNHPYHHD